MTEPLSSDRLVVVAYMDSGNVVQFECDEFEIYRYPETYSDEHGDTKNHPRAWEVSGYNWKADGAVNHRLAELNVDKIEAIVTIRSRITGGE